MAKFIFRLESILKLKEQQKKELELELAKIRVKRIEAENELINIIREKEERRQKIIKPHCIQVSNYQVEYYYLDFLDKKIENQNKKIERIQKLEHSIINDLLKITKEKKIIEKFKERKKEAFDKENLRLENLFLDDLSQRIKTHLKLSE
ncbi:MAG TPA: flagellar export protein FliJ [Bacteroidota bacterium]|jgi:flagellar FliJ protein|nr:flagellar export protein FliJ [Bacteroidota bacterium]